MTKEQKKTVDKIIMVIFYGIFFPLVILSLISLGLNVAMKWLFEKILNPLYNKVCIIIRRPIPNSTVMVKGPEDTRFKRINEKLLTKKEAKALGQQYEENGYEVKLHLSEL